MSKKVKVLPFTESTTEVDIINQFYNYDIKDNTHYKEVWFELFEISGKTEKQIEKYINSIKKIIIIRE